MTPLRGTLVTDGSSDQVLLRPLEWLLRENGCADCEVQWAELRSVRDPPSGLADRVRLAILLFPCEVLFVHRDSERDTIEDRQREIRAALPAGDDHPHICVVPVRMTEAWLLLSEEAIRRAAGNPNGTARLGLPQLGRVESLPDPKSLLHAALRSASGLGGRRLDDFPVKQRVYLVADLVADFSPLRALPAFREVERQVESYLESRKGVDRDHAG